MTDITLRATGTPQAVADAIEAVQAPDTPPEDRAALYGFLYELQRRVNRALGVRQKGATAQHELTEHMTREGLSELGPLYIAWTAFDVEYPVNRADSWTDATVQDGMEAIRNNPATRDFIREVPNHLEIDVLALGSAVHAGSTAARGLYDELREKQWRTEGGRRPALKVREVRKPKGAAA